MISVRESVFESNSSSCHSITLSSTGWSRHADIQLSFKGDDYNWHKVTYRDAQNKLSYWIAAFYENILVKIEREMAKRKGVDRYMLSEYLPLNETHGPADVDVWESVVKGEFDRLKRVVKAIQDCGVRLHFEDSRNSKELIEWEFFNLLDEYSKPRKITDLCHSPKFPVATGGIDHQSGPREDKDCENFANLESLAVVDWVLGDGYFETGNDNDPDYDYNDMDVDS